MREQELAAKIAAYEQDILKIGYISTLSAEMLALCREDPRIIARMSRMALHCLAASHFTDGLGDQAVYRDVYLRILAEAVTGDPRTCPDWRATLTYFDAIGNEPEEMQRVLAVIDGRIDPNSTLRTVAVLLIRGDVVAAETVAARYPYKPYLRRAPRAHPASGIIQGLRLLGCGDTAATELAQAVALSVKKRKHLADPFMLQVLDILQADEPPATLRQRLGDRLRL
jgi:hypothetical protein